MLDITMTVIVVIVSLFIISCLIGVVDTKITKWWNERR